MHKKKKLFFLATAGLVEGAAVKRGGSTAPVKRAFSRIYVRRNLSDTESWKNVAMRFVPARFPEKKLRRELVAYLLRFATRNGAVEWLVSKH